MGSSAGLPLVSVVIPAYNGAGTLPETLDSVLAQGYSKIETIVVDDGSTDDTAAVMSRYAGMVRYVRQPNGGLASARNAGLAQARGEYIALLDADDACVTERIALQVAFLEAHPEIVLCGSDFSAFDRHGEIARSYIAEYYRSVGSATAGMESLFPSRATFFFAPSPSPAPPDEVTAFSGDVYEQLVGGNFIHPPTVMFRRTVLERAGGFDERLTNMCDYDWLIRVSRLGRFGYIDRPLLRYRLSETQMSGDRNRAQGMFEIIEVIKRVQCADPALYQRRRAELRRRIGNCYLGAADALADRNTGAALASLWRSVANSGAHASILKVLLKALVPQALLQRYRKLVGTRQKQGSST